MAEKFTYQVAVEKNPVSEDTPGTPKKTKLESKNSSEDSIWTRVIHTPKSEEKLSFKNFTTKVEVLEENTPKKNKLNWNPSTPERKWYHSLLSGNGHDHSTVSRDIDEKFEIQRSDACSNVEEKLSIRKSSGKVGFVEDPKDPETEVSEEKKWSSLSWLFGSKTNSEAQDESFKRMTRRGATRRKPIIVDVDDVNENHSEKKVTVQVLEETVITPPDKAGRSNKSKLQEAGIGIDQDETKKDMLEEATEDKLDSESKLRKWLLCCCSTAESNEMKAVTTNETEEPKETIETQIKRGSQPKLLDCPETKIDQDETKKNVIEEPTEDDVDSQSKFRKFLCYCCTPAKSHEVKSKTKESEEPKVETQIEPKWELKEEFRQVTTDKVYIKVTA